MLIESCLSAAQLLHALIIAQVSLLGDEIVTGAVFKLVEWAFPMRRLNGPSDNLSRQSLRGSERMRRYQ